ncbi:MAG: acyl carrier protein [Balneolaceae bacterium]|nr:MAG: acyl carrier protein [Balneolaceae bacterium]
MTIEQFSDLIYSLFEVTPSNEITPATDFKELDEWDSLLALEIIALIDEELDISLNGDDIRNVNTIEDLYLVVMKKKKGE